MPTNKITNNLIVWGSDSTKWGEISQDTDFNPGDPIYAKNFNSLERNNSLISYALIQAFKNMPAGDTTSYEDSIPEQSFDYSVTTANLNTLISSFKTILDKYIKYTTVDYSNNAGSAEVSSKLGTSTIGGANKPIYLSAGVATACNDYPSVGNGILTIQKNGTQVDTFAANASSNKTINITVPTDASEIGGITSVKSLNTTATTAQTTSSSEAIDGSGSITLHKISKTGSYTDLLDRPTKLSDFANDVVNNGTLTITRNGTSAGTFTANQSSNSTINITVPTKTSELTNDSDYTVNGVQYTLQSLTTIQQATARANIGAGTGNGSVTSVTIRTGTGLNVSSTSAITTSGTRTISIASGYFLPTTAEWNEMSQRGIGYDLLFEQNSTVSTGEIALSQTTNNYRYLYFEIKTPDGDWASSFVPRVIFQTYTVASGKYYFLNASTANDSHWLSIRFLNDTRIVIVQKGGSVNGIRVYGIN